MSNPPLPDNAQSSAELLSEALSLFLSNVHAEDPIPSNDDQKRKAAYALNLCTVSISQIIDYNDVNFLEREYEAILNNLNLEEMPKDDALLHILKQLLDVVTFFRIQEGEKKLLEKEYQQKMKNAIWNAVPNIGMIVAGGNAVTMAISLASHVGIGYMNYRKEKAKIGLEQERQEWELQRSAMEQFNGLRRELFDTAWRLADKYHFRDSYRLTERQITQFNRILMDSDDLRRYERLDYIKNNFDAYPPFWYYLGNAANAVYQNEEMYDEELRKEYKQLAINAFKKFLSITENNLLREDQLEASCALEYVDLIDNLSEKRKYLTRARKASGNAYDVLELCAMSYLKIGDTGKAAELFRVLVNEDYNTAINAQLLSRLYATIAISEGTVSREVEKKYRTLQSRIGAEHLFPLPTCNDSERSLSDQFLATQQSCLKERYISTLTDYVTKYAAAYERICQMDGNILNEMVELLEQMCKAVQKIVPDERYFIIPLQSELLTNRNAFNQMLTFSKMGTQRTPKIEFSTIFSAPFQKLASEIDRRVDRMDTMYLISQAEEELEQFCADNDLLKKENAITELLPVAKKNPITTALFGRGYEELKKRSDKLEDCLKIVEGFIQQNSILRDNSKKNVSFYCRGTHDFEEYIAKNAKTVQKYYGRQNNIIAIIHNHTMFGQSPDLLMTTGYISLLEGKAKKSIAYAEVEQHCGENGIVFGKTVFKNDAIDMSVLIELFKKLASIQEKYSSLEKEDTLKPVIQCIRHAIRVYSLPSCKVTASILKDFEGILEIETIFTPLWDSITAIAYGKNRAICVGEKYRIHLLNLPVSLSSSFPDGYSQGKYIVTAINANRSVKQIECGQKAVIELTKCSD